MRSATKTVTVPQSGPDHKALDHAIIKMTTIQGAQVESGIHEGCEMFYEALGLRVANQLGAKVILRDGLADCCDLMRRGGASGPEQRVGSMHVEPGYKPSSVMTGIKMAPSREKFDEGSGRPGRKPQIMLFHRATYSAYHGSRNTSSQMHRKLADFTVIEDGEAFGPSGKNHETKYKSQSGQRGTDGVTFPTVRDEYVSQAKEYVAKLNTKMKGDLEVDVRLSYADKSVKLYLSDFLYSDMTKVLHHSYEVYNEQPTQGISASLDITPEGLQTAKDMSYHFAERLKDKDMRITSDSSLQDAVKMVTEVNISGGQLVLDGDEQKKKGVHFARGSAGCRSLVLSFMTRVHVTSTTDSQLSGIIEAKIVGVCVETVRAGTGDREITATLTFPITIIPLNVLSYPRVQSTGVPLNPYGEEQLGFNAVDIVPSLYESESNWYVEKIEKDIRKGDTWTNMGYYRPEGAIPCTANGVEFQHTRYLSKEARIILAEAMISAIIKLSGTNYEPISVREYIEDRRTPSIGVGGMIWHPYTSYGDMKRYSTEDLLVRWAMCFLFGISIDSSTGKSTLYVHNQWRASMAQLPACIYKSGILAWGVSAPMVLLALECGSGKHKSTITAKRGAMQANRYNKVGAGDASEFDFSPRVVLRMPPVKYSTEEAANMRPQAFTVDSQGDLWSHDLTIADAVMQLRIIKQTNDMVVWTPKYMIVVSYTAPDARGMGERATAYVHSGPRSSRLAPSYHARKAVTEVEYSALRIHYASLGRSGALGYMESFVNSAELIGENLSIR